MNFVQYVQDYILPLVLGLVLANCILAFIIYRYEHRRLRKIIEKAFPGNKDKS